MHSSEQTLGKGPLFRGILCNGCYQRIYGVRHLCMFCHYDLCGECKSKGLHSEHDMATIDMNDLFDSLREHIGEIYIE